MTQPAVPAEVEAGGRSRYAGWLAVCVFSLLYMVAYLDRQVINLMVDDIRADLNLTDVQISVLQGLAFVATFVICGLPIGWAVDRYPRRWIVFAGITVWSIAAAAAGLARNYTHLLLARLGVGAGEATLAPVAYSVLADLFPKDRLAFPMAVFSCGAILGMAASLAGGALIVGWAQDQGEVVAPFIGVLRPWQLVFLITGAPGILLGLLVFLISEPKRTPKATSGKPPATNAFKQLARYPGFYFCHFAGFSILGMVAAGWNNWSPMFMVRSLGWSVERTGLTLGLLTFIGGLIGMLASGSLADFLYRRGVRDAHFRIYAIGGFLLAVVGVTAVTVNVVWLMIVCIVFIKAIGAFIAVAAASLQIVTPTQMRGLMSTMFLFVYNVVAYALGPMSIALFTEHVFRDPAKVNLGVAAHFAIFAPMAAIVFIFGLRSMRRAIADGEA